MSGIDPILICGQCGRFSRDPREEMTRHGYGECALLPKGHYRSPVFPCRFTPSQFMPA